MSLRRNRPPPISVGDRNTPAFPSWQDRAGEAGGVCRSEGYGWHAATGGDRRRGPAEPGMTSRNFKAVQELRCDLRLWRRQKKCQVCQVSSAALWRFASRSGSDGHRRAGARAADENAYELGGLSPWIGQAVRCRGGKGKGVAGFSSNHCCADLDNQAAVGEVVELVAGVAYEFLARRRDGSGFVCKEQAVRPWQGVSTENPELLPPWRSTTCWASRWMNSTAWRMWATGPSRTTSPGWQAAGTGRSRRGSPRRPGLTPLRRGR
jgi:hypothetical protein